MAPKSFHIQLSLLLLSLLALGGCHMGIEEEISPQAGIKSYLNLSIAGVNAGAPQSTRAQGDSPSVNSDADDFEDYIRDVAVLVYDAASGNQVKVHFTKQDGFVMEVEAKAGAKYHFCFVANYPEAWKNTLEGLRTYTDLKSALQSLKDFKSQETGAELYNGATETNTFPMARIYENQVIPQGGTFATPKPFTPQTTSPGVLKPVSSWTKSWEEGKTPNTVNLVRSSAKVSILLKGEAVTNVDKVELTNVATQHSYMETSAVSTTRIQPFTLTNNQGSLYIPERLLGSASTSLGWNVTNDAPIGTPTYIQVTMKSGQLYKVPIITYDEVPVGTEYLDLARNQISGTSPDYTIYRNNHYSFTIELPEENKELEVGLRVMPWTLVSSQYSITPVQYTFSISRSDGTTFTAINDEIDLPDINGQPSSLTIKFKITEPVGALWTASITNGQDFILEGDTHGIVDPKMTEHTFTIKPRKPFESTARYTQFYIVVEGREIFLGFKQQGTQTVVDCRYIGAGLGDRWKIKQTLSN